MKQVIHTNEAPQAIGPYSQAIMAGNMLFISGQIPVVPATGEIVSADVEEQTKQCLENLKAVLEENSPRYQQLMSYGVPKVRKLNDN